MDKLKYPVFKIVMAEFGEMQEMESIHFVNHPAIEENWFMFDAQIPVMFSASDNEQRIVTGAVMIPDLPILRFQPVETGGQPIHFYAVADKETIKATAKRLARNGKLGAVGLDHQTMNPEKVFLYQSFISDEATGIKNPKGFEHLPEGTLFHSYIVDNDKIWADAKDGKFNGFSLQSLFGLQQMSFEEAPDNDPETVSIMEQIESDFAEIKKKLIGAI